MYITAFGLLYAAIGAALHHRIADRLGTPVTWCFALLCASAALGVAAVVQVFWHEESLAEPL
jgi:hypothetical protein